MKKKTITITVIVMATILIAGLSYFILTKEDKTTTFNMLEKQWIEKNKNKVIDLSVVNNIPVLNYGGTGIFFEFLEDFEEVTNLEFNKISAQIGEEAKASYAFQAIEQRGKNDILIYQDNYVLLQNKKIKYNQLHEINNMVIGVVDENLERANRYIQGKNITFKTYETEEALIQALKTTPVTTPETEETDHTTTNEVDAILLPKITYMEEIVENDFNITYNITEFTLDYVLSLGETEKLNEIMRKYYEKWASDHYQEAYDKHLSQSYFTFSNVDEKEKVKFRSKRYEYGFIENAPFDSLRDKSLYGINRNFLKQFADIADIEISFKQYKTWKDLLKDFNENKLDLFMESNADTSYDMDVNHTVSVYPEDIVIVSHVENNQTVNSIFSLEYKEIMVVRDTKIASYLEKHGVSLKTYSNMNELLEKLDQNSILAIDQAAYRYYVRDRLKKYKVDYQFSLDDNYQFAVRDIKDNQLFNAFFNFYLGYINEREIHQKGNLELMTSSNPSRIKEIAIFTMILSVMIILFFAYQKIPKKDRNKKNSLSKEDKLKYIDLLTSLKNRNYLNVNIEAWDESDIYPQAIVVIDLNNIAYINDNYGHAEGDNVIKEAANILIRTQIENSEIMRTNGNEFLIYMVGHDEKQVIAYIRKLNKEFKELSHGFGAASGYSMIMDAIKTVDDAINEATLDMRNNKEELNN